MFGSQETGSRVDFFLSLWRFDVRALVFSSSNVKNLTNYCVFSLKTWFFKLVYFEILSACLLSSDSRALLSLLDDELIVSTL